ncbi:MAG: hypothetical protein H6739_33960 [Alphaproteobacteria bacterium]|nr:hypothetical protein [Alphaproteobacteria bacterium]
MRPALPALTVLALGAAVVAALTWPLPLHLGAWHLQDAFSASHAWVADHVFQATFGDRPLDPTAAAGYPVQRHGPFIGLAPILASWALRPVAGPLAAFQVIHLASLPLSALALWPLLRRWTDADRWTCAAACLTFGLCPYLLSTLSIGETPKLQAWLLPLFLWATARWLDGEARGAAWLVALTLVTGFTSPYYGLALPLVIVAHCGLVGAARWRAGWPQRLRAAGGVALVAAALLPVYLYLSGPPRPVEEGLMRPAAAGQVGMALPLPHPVATPRDLLLGNALPARSPYEIVHMAYLGLPLLLGVVALLALRRGGRGLGPGIALLLGGVLLAMGPNLALGEQFTAAPLPATVLGWIGYPFLRGGMWFRLVVLASLGLSVLLAVAASRLPRGAWIAWALALVHVGDAVRATGPWPKPSRAVPGLRALAEMRTSMNPMDGAVLHLPLQEGPGWAESQKMLLAAVVHGRYTTGLTRDVQTPEAQAMRRWVAEAVDAPDPAAALRARGFRYVVLQPMPPLPIRISRETLTEKLGEPAGGPGLWRWDLGPATLAPLDTLPGATP